MGLLLKSLKEKQEKDTISTLSCEKDDMPDALANNLKARLLAYRTISDKKEGKANGVQ